jgi:hypothetical protein
MFIQVCCSHLFLDVRLDAANSPMSTNQANRTPVETRVFD